MNLVVVECAESSDIVGMIRAAFGDGNDVMILDPMLRTASLSIFVDVGTRFKRSTGTLWLPFRIHSSPSIARIFEKWFYPKLKVGFSHMAS